MKFNELGKMMFLGQLFALGCICLLTISVISLARWWKDQPRLPPPPSRATAYKLCWREVNSFMRDPARKGILDGRYDWHSKKVTTKESYPGQFTTIVDIRCEEDADQKGNQGKVYGIAYVLTRGTPDAPPKLDLVSITGGYKYDTSPKRE
jgi:hypothetical protein